MNNNLIKKGSGLPSIGSNLVRNIAEFAKPFKGNIRGVKIDVSILDSNKVWHTHSQRAFKNGSIHIKQH